MSVLDRPIAAWTIVVCAVLAVASPMLSRAGDDFPLSTYPMFTSRRQRALSVDQAVALGPDLEVTVAPRLLGTNEVLQARATLREAVQGGRATADRLCRAIAERVAREPGAPFDHVRSIELRTVTVDAVAWLGGDTRPRATQSHARCRVQR